MDTTTSTQKKWVVKSNPVNTGWNPPLTTPTVRSRLQGCHAELERIATEALDAERYRFWQQILTIDTHIVMAVNLLEALAEEYQCNDNGIAGSCGCARCNATGPVVNEYEIPY